MAGNLTRAEAAHRSQLLTVDSYQVELDLTDVDADHFRSTTLVRFRCGQPAAEVFIDLAAQRLLGVTLNGTEVDPAGYNPAAVRLPLPDLGAENELRVVSEHAYSRTGQGLHRFTDPVDGEVYLWSQAAPADACRLMACFDQPDLKATLDLTVLAPAAWEVVANGPVSTCDTASVPPRVRRGAGTSAGRRRCRPTSSPWWPDRTARSARAGPPLTGGRFRSGCCAALPCSSTSTRTNCSTPPGAGWRSSRASSAGRTRSRSTTSSSCRI